MLEFKHGRSGHAVAWLVWGDKGGKIRRNVELKSTEGFPPEMVSVHPTRGGKRRRQVWTFDHVDEYGEAFYKPVEAGS